MGKILVTSTSAQYVPADPSSRVSIAHARGSSVYYDNTSGVSSGTKDGTLEAGGAAVTFEAGVYLKSAGTSYVWVEDVDELDGRDLATQAELDASAGERTTGPASATDGNLPSFDGETGKKLKDSGVLSSSVVTDSGSGVVINPSAGEFPLTLKIVGDPFIEFQNIATEGNVAPTFQLHGTNGGWGTGIDVAAATPYRDYVLAFKLDYPEAGDVNDFIYCSHNGEDPPTIGLGKAQPTANYRVQIQSDDVRKPAQGSLRIIKGTEQTGDVLTITTTTESTKQWWIDDEYQTTIQSPGAAPLTITNNNPETKLFKVLAAAVVAPLNVSMGAGAPDTPTATLDIAQIGTNNATFKLRTASNGGLAINALGASAAVQLWTSNASSLAIGTNGTARINISSGGNIGFFGHAAAAQPTGVAENAGAIITALKSIGIFA